MDSPKKRPLHYADLTLVQLKTFADRGDPRAAQELARRLGVPRQASESGQASGMAPLASHRQEGTRSSSMHEPPLISERKQIHTPNIESIPRVHSAPPLPSSAATAILQVDVLLASKPSKSDKPDLSHLLFNDAPGIASAGTGTMSPELIAKLEEIARNAPDDDEDEHPPVFLGSGLMALGLIVMLFGFGLSRGPNGTWSFVACGLAMAISGFLYFKGKKFALPVYALTCAMAVIWATYESPTWLEGLLRVAAPLMIAGYAFLPRVRERLT
jgi:hypothetical protein